MPLRVYLIIALAVLGLPTRAWPQAAATQAAPAAQTAQAAPAPGPLADAARTDVADLLRYLRHQKQTVAEEAAGADLRQIKYAFAPIIGYKPTSGVLVGVAGNIASVLGDPATTHMSSAVASLNVSQKKQTTLTARFAAFSAGDRWKFDGDNRFLWTSQDTYGLGLGTAPADAVNQKYDFFRVYETAYLALWPSVYAGAGLHYNTHRNMSPGAGSEAAWDQSPYVTYSEAHGLPLSTQTSAGGSVNVLVDTRDSVVSTRRGWTASANYRAFVEGFLGGSSTWQELNVDARTYVRLAPDARQMIAFWFWGDFVLNGVAPYMDLPTTGMDAYGRSGRGYNEGRFRGERLAYGEVEYRATLTRNGLLGMVAFLNTTTIGNAETGERLFDRFATAGGVGLRLLLNKHSRTNLCMDLGWGRQGSHAIYFGVQEAF